MIGRSLSLLALLLPLAAAYAEEATPKAEETPKLDFELKNSKGETVDLAKFADRIVVLEWMNYDCPFSKRHYERGTFNKLATEYKDEGAVWFAVNSTHYMTPEKNRAHIEKYKVAYPILSDMDGKVGTLFGAKTTPHVFIFKEGKIVYEGAIDDDPGGKKENPTNHVDRALKELTAGKEVSTPETKPYGCSVKYKK